MKYLIYVSDYSRFGCCPDNILPARGPKFQGCAEDLKNISSTPTPSEAPKPKEDCSTSKFGCCPDGNSANTTTLEYCAGIDRSQAYYYILSTPCREKVINCFHLYPIC